jgi:hypothetical protein
MIAMKTKQILSSFQLPIPTLTLRQPVASLVIDGRKQFETRRVKPGSVTEFAIHAGKSDLAQFQPFARQSVDDWPELEMLPRGVLGIVRIVAVFNLNEYFDYSSISDLERKIGYWKPGYFAWQLEVMQKFERPIPEIGKLGWWKWNPVGDV